MMTTSILDRPYIYAVLPDKKLRWWNGTGWSDHRDKAKRYGSDAEAECYLRSMLREGLKAKIGKERISRI